jgi:hypothetical protein
MTSFAERVFGRSYGRQPEIADGIRGEAFVLQSIASLTPTYMNMDHRIVGGWKAWACSIPLLVTLPGKEPYSASPVRWMSRAKFPIGGTTLPVTVERADRSMIRIDWDEVPDIDEWIVSGHEVFTDPESVQTRFDEAWAAHRAAIVEAGTADLAAQVSRATPTGVDPAAVQRLMADLQAEHAERMPKPKLKRPQVDGPSGRILAVGIQDGNARESHGEVLLSVSVPGSPRYGARCSTSVPASKMKLEWWDVPVDVDPANPARVKIRWDEVAGIEAIAPLIRERSAQLEEMLAAPSLTTMSTQATPGAAVDPIDELARLGERRAAGELSDEEFAAEKARLLGEI